MTIAVAQIVVGSDPDFSHSGTAISGTLTVSSGSTLHVFGTNDSGSGQDVSSVADNVNAGNWEALLDNVNDTNDQRVWQLHRENVASGSTTVTATFSAACVAKGVQIYEITGAASPSLNKHTGQKQSPGPGTGADLVTSGPMIPTLAPLMLVAFSMEVSGANGPPTAHAGYTDDSTSMPFNTGSANLARSEHSRLTTTASVGGVFTATATGGIYLTAAALYAESGATAGGGSDVPISGAQKQLLVNAIYRM